MMPELTEYNNKLFTLDDMIVYMQVNAPIFYEGMLPIIDLMRKDGMLDNDIRDALLESMEIKVNLDAITRNTKHR
ncbi:MAG: hypothetical protein HC836_22835 [Richelia sp. RM2_1_2]|nr:hypothetical protein [Richelia sp. RM2_1_2]